LSIGLGERLIAALIIGVVVGAARFGVGLLINRKRQSRAATPEPMREPAATPPPPTRAIARKPVLRGVNGHHEGTVMELDATPFVLGRDARASSAIFPANYFSIAPRHCAVRYDGARFLVEDCGSSRGTFLVSGRPIQPGRPQTLLPGERFYLGDPGNLFEVAFQ
jgi:FHA domain